MTDGPVYGNIFSIGANGTNFQNLFSFNGTNGDQPHGGLTLLGSTLYGMTPYGGAFGDGDIFSIGTNGMGFDDLVDFTGTGGEYPGANPQGDLSAHRKRPAL